MYFMMFDGLQHTVILTLTEAQMLSSCSLQNTDRLIYTF